MTFRAVLFDAAETLFTTRGSVGEIYSSVARKYGAQASSEEIQAAFLKNFQGAGPLAAADQKRWWRNIVYQVFKQVGMFDNFERFFEEVYDRFRDSQGWVLFPETLDVLEQLQQWHLKLGIISNFDSRIYSVLDSLEIRHFFDAVVLSSETGFCKPDPEIFAAGSSAIGVPPAEALFVGDSPQDDVEAAIRAGFAAVLIDRTGRFSKVQHLQRISSLKEVLLKVTP
jgi:putative hydrolase of the HAD superfamily